jgi:hypothetical protein
MRSTNERNKKKMDDQDAGMCQLEDEFYDSCSMSETDDKF